ncbi:MAG: hypothetical protein FWC09_01800 [Lachnospiraceae bacterium]|nr:hypothetical protein [Lachnospiraceae bacterium]
MFLILLENILLTLVIIALMILSIAGQIMIGSLYQKLISEADNLSTTENKYLKLCKLKFQNCYQLNGSIPNISVFVDKFISRLVIFRISLDGIRRISSQLMMLAVFTCGVGACIGIINGEVMLRLLPYYVMAIVGLYIYFSVAAFVDIPSRRETLKINLMDYLENHLLSRLKNNLSDEDSTEKLPAASRQKEDEIKQIIEPIPIKADEVKSIASQFSDDEIEELLQELIV